MQGSGAPSGVSGDATRDDAGASRAVVANFFGRAVRLANDGHEPTPFVPYFNGTDKFLLQFGTPGGAMSFTVWTDESGVMEVIAALQVLLMSVEHRRLEAEAGDD